MVRLLVSMPEGLKAKLKEKAKPRGQTLSGLIREILWDWIEKKGG